jgi:ferrous iron transport protein A
MQRTEASATLPALRLNVNLPDRWANEFVTSMQVVPLEMLRSGEQGRIEALDGPEDLVHRLAEMGLRVGVTIRMVRAGSPCILALDHHRLSFRHDEASILVAVLPP